MVIETGKKAKAADVVQIGKSIYGDGSDGDITLGSNTTITSDMHYDTLDLAGYTLSTNGYVVLVKDTLTPNGGIISGDGADAGVPPAAGATGVGHLKGGAGGVGKSNSDGDGSGGGGGGANSVFLAARIIAAALTVRANGGDGGDAAVGSTAASMGVAGTSVIRGGAVGGAGETSQTRAGGAAGGSTLPTDSLYQMESGGGGGGGGGDYENVNDAGGGGGGGGGNALVIYSSKTGALTITATGGTKGTGVGSHDNDHADGSAGKTRELVNLPT